ncbi:uncharacterized protein [Temnothorax nylanderi]|uniref:uncharacterized protein n=1 Tax=Temnothorax nylanderi TaxID=102681 RepID=UPI003A85EF76
MLSNCIRNRRAFLKKKILSDGSSAKKVQRTTIQMCVLPSTSAEPESSLSTPDMAKEDITADLETLMSKLKDTKPCATNLQHIKMLMLKTKKMRRDWIVNKETGARCSTILKQFPYLKNSELLQHDFDLLGIWKSSAVQNLDILLEKLSKLFKENATTESEKLFLLMKAEKALIPNKALSSCKAITTCKIYESPDILKTEENESPRLVIFLDNSRVSQAFIVADKKVELAVDNPTVASCIRSLIGMCYVCDIMYPKSYSNFFHLIDFEVIGIPKPKTLPTKFCTFVKKLNST